MALASERVARMNMLFNLDTAAKTLYVKLEALSGLPLASTPGPGVAMFVRLAILPTSVKDVEQVAKVVFKPTLGAKFTPNMMRGRTLPHPAAEGADLNEEFVFNLDELLDLPALATQNYRLHLAVIGTEPDLAINGTHCLGCCSFSITELVENAKPIFNPETGAYIQRAMTKARWFWLFSPRVGLGHSESVKQIKAVANSYPASVGAANVVDMIQIRGRDGFAPNSSVVDEYCWVPTRFGDTHVYKGDESNLWMYHLGARGVWAIGTAIGSSIPLATVDGTADKLPIVEDTAAAYDKAGNVPVWQVYSAELDAEACLVDSSEVVVGAYFPDFDMWCGPSDEASEITPFVEGAGMSIDASAWQTARVVIDKDQGSQPGSTGLSFSAEAGKGVRITGVREGGSAWLTGKLAVGMCIVVVNETDVRNSPKTEAQTLIRESNRHVSLTVEWQADQLARREVAGAAAAGGGDLTRVLINKQTGGQPGSTGLSFSYIPGRGHMITNVVPGSAAALTGQVRKGQYIMSVATRGGADTDVRNLSKEDTGRIIRGSGDSVELVLENIEEANSISLGGMNRGSMASIGSVSGHSAARQVSIVLDGKTLGVSFRGRPAGVVVSKVKDGGAAFATGLLKVGDVVTKINDLDVTGGEVGVAAIKEAVQAQVVEGTIELEICGTADRLPSSNTGDNGNNGIIANMTTAIPEGAIEVVVDRKMSQKGSSLGIAFDPSPGNAGMTIHVVREGFAAHVQGELKEGMRIIAVNGTSVVGVEKSAVVALLRARDDVTFMVVPQ